MGSAWFDPPPVTIGSAAAILRQPIPGRSDVSAAAAVVWAAKPTLTNTGLLNLLTSTARDLGTAGRDNNFGYGLVDPLKAITGQ